MRDVKFRGKTRFTQTENKWVYGYVLSMFREISIMEPQNETQVYPVDESTVGQFTGRKDTNRVEIFEGDKVVIRDDYEETGIVAWDNEELEYVIKSENVSLKMGCFYASELEVVGNIHESEGERYKEY
jgi:uncharacterized phage protein (TIGR01671 family)